MNTYLIQNMTSKKYYVYNTTKDFSKYINTTTLIVGVNASYKVIQELDLNKQIKL